MHSSFFTKEDIKISNEFKRDGFVIRNVTDKSSLDYIQSKFTKLIKKIYKLEKKISNTKVLNFIHKKIKKNKLNEFRLKAINEINKDKNCRYYYFKVVKPYLEAIAGNELVMQKKINLSIQLPGDENSLLAVHSDVWSGDSPFEVVVWLPLVNCFKTKSMYILPANLISQFNKKISKKNYLSSEKIFQLIKQKVKWIIINYGEVLIFNQSLPHGNRVNKEYETRWSLNCRFKNIFSPYGDKKIGEFFEPITLRAASEIGLKYKLPRMK